MGGSRRLPWVLVAVLLMVVTALVVVLILRDDGSDEVAGDAATPPSDTPTAGPTSTTEAEQTGAGSADEAAGGAGDAGDASGSDAGDLPLTEPGAHLPADGSSDVPALGADLVEGDYVAHVTDADLDDMVLSADVEALYVGEAADDYLREHDPTAEIPPPNGFVLVNESTNVRQVPIADDVRIWDWCFGADGRLAYAERTPIEWWLAPPTASQECSAGAGLGHGGDLYWLQVRDGEVRHLIGQYLP